MYDFLPCEQVMIGFHNLIWKQNRSCVPVSTGLVQPFANSSAEKRLWCTNLLINVAAACTTIRSSSAEHVLDSATNRREITRIRRYFGSKTFLLCHLDGIVCGSIPFLLVKSINSSFSKAAQNRAISGAYNIFIQRVSSKSKAYDIDVLVTMSPT